MGFKSRVAILTSHMRGPYKPTYNNTREPPSRVEPVSTQGESYNPGLELRSLLLRSCRVAFGVMDPKPQTLINTI